MSPCVTASMDDIHFQHTIRLEEICLLSLHFFLCLCNLHSAFSYASLFRVGQVVNITAKVNRAFNTSMEVG